MDRNRRMAIGVGASQLVLLLVYSLTVVPQGETSLPSLGESDATTFLLGFVACWGLLYINSYKRENMYNVFGSWLIMLIVVYELYFLFLAMFLSIKYRTSVKPVMSPTMAVQSQTPLIMMTIVYANLKGFLKVQELIIITVLGTLGFAGNLVLCAVKIRGYDMGGGLYVYLFAVVFAAILRAVGLPIRAFSKHNKTLPISNNMALYGILFTLIYFPTTSSGFIGFSNCLFCMLFAIMGYVLVELKFSRKIRLQRIFQLCISSAILMSVGGTFFQNLLSPGIIGLGFGIFNSKWGNALRQLLVDRVRVPDPSQSIMLFGIPSVMAVIFSFIAISAYQIKSTNKIGDQFNYPDILLQPVKVAGKELLILVVTISISAVSGGIGGLVLKYMSDNNDIEGQDLIWAEDEEALGLEYLDDEDPRDYQRPTIPPNFPSVVDSVRTTAEYAQRQTGPIQQPNHAPEIDESRQW